MKRLFLICLTAFAIISCRKNEVEIQQDMLKSDLDKMTVAIPQNPDEWTENQLSMLNILGNKKIVALGEATHGTSEFFKAKHRIFKYLVEKHGFRVFAIEADFGESLLLNEAIRAGKTTEIGALMKEKMIFWTWRTEEVKNFLEWMSEYNKNKPESEKISYVGIDCQSNRHNPSLLVNYLQKTDTDLYKLAENVLSEAANASNNNYMAYDVNTYNSLTSDLDKLLSIVNSKKDNLVRASSLKEYQLNERILMVIKQVVLYTYRRNIDKNFGDRDKYMAENVEWLSNYFGDQKMVVWAHNAHIEPNSNYINGIGSMGYFLRNTYSTNYAILGFSFSNGSFTAVRSGVGLGKQTINETPVQSSLNEVFSRADEKNFFVDMQKLSVKAYWVHYLTINRSYLSIGAVYNGNHIIYYRDFKKGNFDYMIYFDKTNASIILN